MRTFKLKTLVHCQWDPSNDHTHTVEYGRRFLFANGGFEIWVQLEYPAYLTQKVTHLNFQKTAEQSMNNCPITWVLEIAEWRIALEKGYRQNKLDIVQYYWIYKSVSVIGELELG